MQGYPYRRVAAASILRAFSNQKGARIMPNPTTLRNLSGLPAAPAALAESALVLIDCQNTYRDGSPDTDE